MNPFRDPPQTLMLVMFHVLKLARVQSPVRTQLHLRECVMCASGQQFRACEFIYFRLWRFARFVQVKKNKQTHKTKQKTTNSTTIIFIQTSQNGKTQCIANDCTESCLKEICVYIWDRGSNREKKRETSVFDKKAPLLTMVNNGWQIN